jgi:hypothetical protein
VSHELLHHVEPKLFFCLLKLFKFALMFEFDLKTIGKIKRKGIRNSKEKGKPISAQHSPLQPSGVVCPRPLSPPSLYPVGLVCWCQSPSRPRSLSVSRGRLVSAIRPPPPPPPRARSLSLHRGTPSQIRLLREPLWTSAHAHREPQPCRLPTRPSSILSIARTRSLYPASFRASSPSLALCSRRSRSMRSSCQPSSPSEACQASPSAVPR